jgi:hypothetical protein
MMPESETSRIITLSAHITSSIPVVHGHPPISNLLVTSTSVHQVELQRPLPSNHIVIAGRYLICSSLSNIIWQRTSHGSVEQ